MINSTDLLQLEKWVNHCLQLQPYSFGYPINQHKELNEFYQWYAQSGITSVNLNNVGSPFDESDYSLNSHPFEREVIEYFAPFFGFDKDHVWGLVTNSGTDGNNHGIFFATNLLYKQTGQLPVAYVSKEAHYSNRHLCNIQNLEVRLIETDPMGRMIPHDLERQLDPSRGALVIFAMGSTLKGAIDDIDALNAVLDRHPDMPVYRHVDAALFGGYLPFTPYKDLVDHRTKHFQSIAISGHKFFGLDSPCGLFITSRDMYDAQSNLPVAYLNHNMRMINCSRDGLEPLKFWWLIRQLGADHWAAQATTILKNTEYLKQQLDLIHWPNWSNEYSNTVFIRRPNKSIMQKYTLASGFDEAFGGELAHVVVMQHVTHQAIDLLISDLQNSL